MTEFYKEKNFCFKLKDITVTEQFSLWIGWKQQLTDEEMIKQYGIVLQFPVKEGQLQGIDGVPRDVLTQIKFMKKPDFEAQYPKLGKNTRYLRNIIVNGVEYRFGFSKTSNDKLNAMLSLQPGVIPQNVFKQTFDVNKTAAQMYDITVATPEETSTANVVPTAPVQQPIATPPPVAQPQVAQQPVATASMITATGLTDGEKTILSSVKGLPNKLDKDKFIKVFVQNLTKPEFGGLIPNDAPQRALVIFENHYN